MLRLHDARTGELRPAQPEPGRALTVHVCGGDRRTLLVADLIRRAGAVIHDWRVVVTAPRSLHAMHHELNIHPAEAADTSDNAIVHVAQVHDDAGCCGSCGSQPIGCLVNVGALRLAADPRDTDPRDPLALRFALLDSDYRRELAIDRHGIEGADATVRRWRSAVATWARSPGAPMSREHAGAITAAYDDDLATRLALDVLRDLEIDDSVAPGAKFETFAYADRLLGLDLASDVGR